MAVHMSVIYDLLMCANTCCVNVYSDRLFHRMSIGMYRDVWFHLCMAAIG